MLAAMLYPRGNLLENIRTFGTLPPLCTLVIRSVQKRRAAKLRPFQSSYHAVTASQLCSDGTRH
jgi:hypothetical protein